jgi:hypothetical protein
MSLGTERGKHGREEALSRLRKYLEVIQKQIRANVATVHLGEP